MKKMLAVLCLLVFSVLALSACGNPCDKAWDKMAKCGKKQGVPEKAIEKMKDEFMKGCKKHKDKFKDCLKKDDCKEFDRCIENIMK